MAARIAGNVIEVVVKVWQICQCKNSNEEFAAGAGRMHNMVDRKVARCRNGHRYGDNNEGG